MSSLASNKRARDSLEIEQPAKKRARLRDIAPQTRLKIEEYFPSEAAHQAADEISQPPSSVQEPLECEGCQEPRCCLHKWPGGRWGTFDICGVCVDKLWASLTEDDERDAAEDYYRWRRQCGCFSDFMEH